MNWITSWFSSSKPSDSSGGIAPDRAKRKVCWDARDTYFACLDKNSVLKPGEEQNLCSKEEKRYEENCAKSWIEYFNKRRVLQEEQKDQLKMMENQANDARKRN
ncbi:hypothetical protein Clacol_001310 [Clathrus columnatus]|uniref:Cytochrome c oxidase assembly factor 6 n=1 Tax=Clathrus columnatus TaxID=1419009 RepID=A0AAV4ZYX0_9AGAM|nr:hypothetical protein Clacol_001310 [Clathrus columnatus]